MILIDAVFLNSKGGKVLLNMLINELINKENIFFLLDSRLKNDFPHIKKNFKYIKPSLIKRHFFYLKNKNRFYKVLAFSSIPPTIKLKCTVITFFQNVILLDDHFTTFKLFIKHIILKLFKNNTDLWISQTQSVKNLIINKLKHDSKVLILPIFDNLNNNFGNSALKKINKLNVKFLYVSSGEVYKNHINLIHAFIKFNKIYKNSSLTITVDKSYKSIIKIIDSFKNSYNIINKGNIDRHDLISEYLKSDICVYPSTRESFGLGLIEAAQFHLPIIASNLPYVHSVVKPSSIFNPYDKNDIFDKLYNFDYDNYNPSKLIVSNEIRELINLILNNNKKYV